MATKKVMLFVGTRKGGLVCTSDEHRQEWELSGLHFKSWNVMHMVLDSRHNRLHAAVVHDVYGPSVHYSDDFGGLWKQADVQPSFNRPSLTPRPLSTAEDAKDPDEALKRQEALIKPWNITPGRFDEGQVLYLGVEPASLFKSMDGGQTWELNPSLYDHPHREHWYPGAGGLCLHTIVLDPEDPDRTFVAISAGGVYLTEDGGISWVPRNQNVRADFLPDPFPEFGQCVHKVVMHPSDPEVLYQQNHCGMYRSEDGGSSWMDIGEGKLPSRFGFPIGVHPHDGDTIFIVPEESDGYRVSVEGEFAVWRSQDRGESWKRLTNGLPERAHLVVLREAMALDSLENAGVYIGTSTGQIFFSRDAGDHWELMADFLPPILSLEAAVIEE